MKNKNYLIGIAFVLIVLLFVIFDGFDLLKKKESQNTSSLETEKFLDPTFIDKTNDYRKDSDGDRVPDWEENLYPELNPELADSDGDGVSDYIHLRRLKTKSIIQESKGQEPERYSSSDELSYGLYLSLTSILNSDDAEMSDEDRDQIEKNIESYIKNLDIDGSQYIQSDLTVVDVALENNKKYKQDIEKIWKKYLVSREDLLLMWSAAEKPDLYSYEAQQIFSKYSAYENELKELSVPKVLVARHLSLLNFVSAMRAVSENIQKQEVDDLLSLAFLYQLDDRIEAAQESVVKTKKYFELAGL